MILSQVACLTPTTLNLSNCNSRVCWILFGLSTVLPRQVYFYMGPGVSLAAKSNRGVVVLLHGVGFWRIQEGSQPKQLRGFRVHGDSKRVSILRNATLSMQKKRKWLGTKNFVQCFTVFYGTRILLKKNKSADPLKSCMPDTVRSSFANITTTLYLPFCLTLSHKFTVKFRKVNIPYGIFLGVVLRVVKGIKDLPPIATRR